MQIRHLDFLSYLLPPLQLCILGLLGCFLLILLTSSQWRAPDSVLAPLLFFICIYSLGRASLVAQQ